MYKAYFKLNSNPFSPTPPPDFIFQSKELKEALAHFSFALENREAFLLLTGEVGTGKTTAVQSVLRLLPQGTPVALVTHTTLEPRELLEEIALRFGLLQVEDKSKPVLLRQLEDHFEQQWAEGRQSLLILDEAHLLKPDVLEEVRLLSNLEREGGKLVQICLVGQPELIAHLQRPELRQLRQRISVRYALRPLSESETRDYVVHRLRAAGSPAPESVFTEASLQEIHRLTHGIPREINVIAGQSLLNAFLSESPQVRPEHVASVHQDYGFEGLRQVKTPSKPTPEAPPPVAPPPVTQLRPLSDPPPGESVVEPPRPGLKQRPIPLPPEHLRPTPRQQPTGGSSPSATPPPQPVPIDPPTQKPLRPQGEPVPLKSPTASRQRSSGGSMAWIPWVLVLGLGLFLAWRFWLAPMVMGEPAAQETRDQSAVPTPRGSSEFGGSPGLVDTSAAVSAAQDSQRVAPPETARVGLEPLPGGADKMDTVLTAEAGNVQDPGNWSRLFLVSSDITDGAYRGDLTAQVASIRGRERADQLLREIKAITGLSGTAVPSQVGGRQWYRILVGRFGRVQDVEEALTPLLRQRLVTEVMVIPAPAGLLDRLSGNAP